MVKKCWVLFATNLLPEWQSSTPVSFFLSILSSVFLLHSSLLSKLQVQIIFSCARLNHWCYIYVHSNSKCKMPKETWNFSKSLRTRSGCWCSIILLLFRGRTPAFALFTSLLVSSRSFLSSCSLLSFSFLISLSFCFLLCLSCSQLIL